MQSQKDIEPFTAIAHVQSVFQQKFGTPRQGALTPSSRAEIHLTSGWRGKGVFEGLDGFSHVWLITYLHKNGPTRPLGKVHPPRLEGQKVGVLASRSPHRPNPIGLTLARLLEVKRDSLVVGEIDLLDGTPVLDIKPYLASADRPVEFTNGWVDEVASPDLVCRWSAGAEAQLQTLNAPDHFRSLVTEMLRQDPRPLVYRERERENYAVMVNGIDVKFRFKDGAFEVTELLVPTSATESIETPESSG